MLLYLHNSLRADSVFLYELCYSVTRTAKLALHESMPEQLLLFVDSCGYATLSIYKFSVFKWLVLKNYPETLQHLLALANVPFAGSSG